MSISALDLMFADPKPAPNRRSMTGVVRTTRPDTLEQRQSDLLASLSARIEPYGSDHARYIVASEVYRAHTRPDMYDGWQLDLIDETWNTIVADKVSWDCDGCHKAVIAETFEHACPNGCGQ